MTPEKANEVGSRPKLSLMMEHKEEPQSKGEQIQMIISISSHKSDFSVVFRTR